MSNQFLLSVEHGVKVDGQKSRFPAHPAKIGKEIPIPRKALEEVTVF